MRKVSETSCDRYVLIDQLLDHGAGRVGDVVLAVSLTQDEDLFE